MGVAGRSQTCFPTEGFVILGLHPCQELGSGSESLRAGHIAWSPLYPQSGETEIHVRPGDGCWWWKAQRWPAWWGRSGAAAAAPRPGWGRGGTMSGWRGPASVAQLTRGKQGPRHVTVSAGHIRLVTAPRTHACFIRPFLPGVGAKVLPRFPFSALPVLFQAEAQPTCVCAQTLHFTATGDSKVDSTGRFSSLGTLLSGSAAFRVDGEPSRGQPYATVNSARHDQEGKSVETKIQKCPSRPDGMVLDCGHCPAPWTAGTSDTGHGELQSRVVAAIPQRGDKGRLGSQALGLGSRTLLEEAGERP